jgi:hypothetical protein
MQTCPREGGEMKKKTLLLGVKLTGGLEEEMTSWAGISLAIELWRKCGAMEKTERVLPQKKSSKGLTTGQMVESFPHLRGDKYCSECHWW